MEELGGGLTWFVARSGQTASSQSAELFPESWGGGGGGGGVLTPLNPSPRSATGNHHGVYRDSIAIARSLQNVL